MRKAFIGCVFSLFDWIGSRLGRRRRKGACVRRTGVCVGKGRRLSVCVAPLACCPCTTARTTTSSHPQCLESNHHTTPHRPNRPAAPPLPRRRRADLPGPAQGGRRCLLPAGAAVARVGERSSRAGAGAGGAGGLGKGLGRRAGGGAFDRHMFLWAYANPPLQPPFLHRSPRTSPLSGKQWWLHKVRLGMVTALLKDGGWRSALVLLEGMRKARMDRGRRATSHDG